jgi:phytoene/squalene synthetase
MSNSFSLYENTCLDCSRITTENYSTSFSLGIKLLDKIYHQDIYSVYGFVRFADEIVDTFHDYDKAKLIYNFKQDTFKALSEGISLNPILHSFQKTVNTYLIDYDLIEAFFYSMELDLNPQNYTNELYEKYIYGSAEVVGLMCLKIFCHGEENFYQSLVKPARALGSAFQKVNFLRDLKADFRELGRSYFPDVTPENFNEIQKQDLIMEIEDDFSLAYEGISQLPNEARLGVFSAYSLYQSLLDKLKGTPAEHIINERIRINDFQKVAILGNAYLKCP